jgi:hypothetical protein
MIFSQRMLHLRGSSAEATGVPTRSIQRLQIGERERIEVEVAEQASPVDDRDLRAQDRSMRCECASRTNCAPSLGRRKIGAGDDA